MKAQLICNGKTIEVEVADEQFEKLFVDKKTGYERVSETSYWRIGSEGLVIGDADYNTAADRCRYEFANYFSDKSVAENMARAQRLWNNIHRRAVELCEPVYQRKDNWYFTICFDPKSSKLYADDWITRRFGLIYFDTVEHCEQVINEFRDELMWYFTEFKDRADM